MLRPGQGNWGLKCVAVQDRALNLYPGSAYQTPLLLTYPNLTY